MGAGEIKDRQASGLDEAEAADLGQLISSRQSPSLIAFRFQAAEGKAPRSLSLTVARYTPQAVLTANIEEADYSALITSDGKMLVQSRFAVRNNQRNFLKLNLPAPRSVERFGRRSSNKTRTSADGSLLLPLEKTSTGDDASAFVVEVSYLDRTHSGSTKVECAFRGVGGSADFQVAPVAASSATLSLNTTDRNNREFPRRALRSL